MDLSDLPNLPPHNPHAEASLIGGAMLENTRFDDVGDVAPSDFYIPEHRELWEALSALASEGRPFDLVTVAERLERTGRLEAAGGLAYVGQIVNDTPSAANAEHYARMVRSNATLRRLAQACQNGLERALSPGETDAATLAAEIEASVYRAAERMSDQGPRSAAELVPDLLRDLDDRSRGEGPRGVRTGLTDLDRALGGMDPGQLILIGARPGIGKSALALGIALNVAVEQGRPVALFTLEMSAHEVGQRALGSVAGVPVTRLRSGRLEASDWDAVSSASGILHRAPLHIDETGGIRPAELRARVRRIKRRAGDLGLVVVDYLQLMQGDRDRRTDNRVGELTHISGSLKALAKEVGAPVLALSQLNRGLENRANRRPMLADLRESGSLEQDADVVLLLFRDDESAPGSAEIIIAKQRNGPTGTVRVAWRGELARFDSAARLPGREAPLRRAELDRLARAAPRRDWIAERAEGGR